MKPRLLYSVASAATISTIITYFAFTSDAGTVSAESEDNKRERFEQHTRSVIERNDMLKVEQRNQPPDPSITDDVALGLVLRFISGNQNEQQKNQVRQYMSDILGVKNRADQDKLFTAGEAYRMQSNQIQMQSEATTLKYHPSHDTMTNVDKQTLRQLVENKKNLIKDSKRTLRQDLSNAAWSSIALALSTRVKPRIKVSRHQ